jgi:hypothetical protein
MEWLREITEESKCYYQAIIANKINFHSSLSCSMRKKEKEGETKNRRKSRDYFNTEN